MRSSTAGRALAILVCGLPIAACSGGGSAGSSAAPSTSGPPPVAWSVVQTLIGAPTGSYEKETTAQSEEKDYLLSAEWVDYDLGRKLIDRRIGFADNPSTPAVEPTATRDAPSLRFFLDSAGMTMWNPAAEDACGTPWVRLPPDEVATAAGGSLDAAFLGVEPTVILSSVRGAPTVLGSDETQTVFVVAVPGAAGVPSTALNSQPAVASALAEETTPATVTVTRDGKQLTLTVDITNALARLSSQVEGAKSAVSWRLGPLDSMISGLGDAKVADAACMD